MADTASLGGAPAPTIDWASALEKHKPWLQKVLRCRVGDWHEVDDLFQEIALAVYRQSAKPDDPNRVAPWLYRLAVRQAINFHRRRGRKSTAEPVAEIDAADTSPEPLDWMLADEQQRNMRRALSKLSRQDREIMMLKYTESWNYRQLAEHLGVKERTVEYRLLKARKRLRKLLLAESGDSASLPSPRG